MDIEQERQLLAKYPYHIVALVRAAKEAVQAGRSRIDHGVLLVDPQMKNDQAKPNEHGSEIA